MEENNIPVPPLEEQAAQQPTAQTYEQPYEPEQQATPIDDERETKVTDTIWFRLGVILLITMLLFIPLQMVSSLNHERQQTALSAQDEITGKWAQPQHITGPILAIPYGEGEGAGTLYVLPKSLNANADVKSQTLHRSIYEAVVYNSTIDLKGTFNLRDELANFSNTDKLHMDKARILVGLTDLRGISTPMKLQLGGNHYEINDGGIDSKFQDKSTLIALEGIELGEGEELNTTRGTESVVCSVIDANALLQSAPVPYSLTLELKGSEMISFAPIGESTQIHVKGDCATPSFMGFILPADRKVDNKGFEATWNMIGVNRTYSQSFSNDCSRAISKSHVAVSLKVPVENGQKTERALKYGLLVIVLTFAAAFFTELKTHKRINILQYVLVGLALVLFYSLLLSIGEHVAFGIAYLIAALMTVTMVALYVSGVLKARKHGMMIGGLLALLYGYIYILLSLETWALVAGSVGLFIILSVIMRYSLELPGVSGKNSSLI